MFSWLGDGRVWMIIWLSLLGLTVIWGLVTVMFFMDSVKNLNMLSIVALIVAAMAGVQSTLGMRKADPEDPL